MIRIRFNKTKKLNEVDFTGGNEIGLVVALSGEYHNLIFFNIDSFSQYLSTLPLDDEKHQYLKIDSKFHEFNKKNPIIIGYVSIQETDEDGPCFNALRVAYSTNHLKYSNIGFGKEMYKIAMAYSSELGKPIRPDINGPEEKAQNVWRSLEKDDARIIKSFDFRGKPVANNTSNSLNYMDFKEPKETEAEIDDCKKNHLSANKNFLNRAYYSTSAMSTYHSMQDRGTEFLTNHFEDLEYITDEMDKLAGDLFWSRYKK